MYHAWYHVCLYAHTPSLILFTFQYDVVVDKWILMYYVCTFTTNEHAAHHLTYNTIIQLGVMLYLSLIHI